MGDATMAVQARLMSQALRKLTGAISKSKTSVIFINQLRSKIGVFFGNPETTTGGNALKFYASLRLDIRRIAAIKDGTDIIGNRTKVKIVKSKVAPPFKEVEFDILYNEGISKTGDLLDLAVNFGIVKKGGAWFTFEEDRFQGREQFRQKMVEDSVFFEKISKEVKTKLGILPAEKEKGKDEPAEKEKAPSKEKKSK
jgi:recombination protein RecA